MWYQKSIYLCNDKQTILIFKSNGMEFLANLRSKLQNIDGYIGEKEDGNGVTTTSVFHEKHLTSKGYEKIKLSIFTPIIICTMSELKDMKFKRVSMYYVVKNYLKNLKNK